jgi:uncharacterized protein YuzE
MDLTYDPEANMAYIRLGQSSRGVVHSEILIQDQDLPGDLTVDLDRNGQLHGIEIFNARSFLPQAVLARASLPKPPS